MQQKYNPFFRQNTLQRWFLFNFAFTEQTLYSKNYMDVILNCLYQGIVLRLPLTYKPQKGRAVKF
jgi:hypothetical protein